MNINRNHLRFSLNLILMAFAACAVVQAQDQSQPPIVGSWQITVSSVAAGPQFAPFPGLLTIHADGTVIESDGANTALPLAPPNPFCNCTLIGIDQGHGVWRRVGDRKYQIKFQQIAINVDDSSLVLTNSLQFTVDLSGNNRFQGPGAFALADAHGMPIQGFSGPEQIEGHRIVFSDTAGGESAVTIALNGGAGVFPIGANAFQVTTNQIGLDASQSRSSSGSALSYFWASSPGFPSAAITRADTAAPLIQLSTKATYQFTVTVTDANGFTATQTFTIQYV